MIKTGVWGPGHGHSSGSQPGQEEVTERWEENQERGFLTKEVRKVLQEEEEGGTVKPLMDQIEWASDSICDFVMWRAAALIILEQR